MRAAIVIIAACVITSGCARPVDPQTPTPMATSQPTSQPAEITALGEGWHLAPSAKYSATQSRGEVTLHATGESPTAGYQLKLVQSMLRIWPPQYLLARKKPEGIVIQVITPFDVSASFKSNDPVKSVKVRDAADVHDVNVDQAQD